MGKPMQIIPFLLLTLLVFAACGKKEVKKEAPATMSNPVKETELNTIRLTPKAESRLGIQTTTVQSETIGNTRIFSGEVMAVPGGTVTLTAPFAGRLTAVNAPVAGQRVAKGQGLYRLLILPSERDLVSAPEDVNQRRAQYELAVQKAERAKRMLEDKSGSLRAKQEADAELAAARAQLGVANARTELLKGNTAAASKLSALQVQAPVSGVVQKVYTASSQVVAAGVPLLDIAALNNVWIRVPVYAGDGEKIDRQASARVGSLSGFATNVNSAVARPVSGPQTADPTSTSIDLFYELSNEDGLYRPGQKVSVSLPIGGSGSGLAVPFSAITYDINGGSWVYQTDSPHVYVRKRVEIKTANSDMAIISRGISPGARIVIVGAAELFGTEFGGGK